MNGDDMKTRQNLDRESAITQMMQEYEALVNEVKWQAITWGLTALGVIGILIIKFWLAFSLVWGADRCA